MYTVCGNILPTVDSVTDLGILRSTNFVYDEHCCKCYTARLIISVERLQHMFKKCIRCIANLPNDERINYFGLERL